VQEAIGDVHDDSVRFFGDVLIVAWMLICDIV
jgi:hypothetical protein